MLRECDGSGISQERFAQQKQISVATLHRWRKKYGQMDEADAKRLKALEDVGLAFNGVEKCFAIQAGREIRIMVKPEAVDDVAASKMARDIVKKIEETLVYPGQIKVTLIRESRTVEFAR